MSGLPSREIVVSIGAVAALRLASYCVYRRWTSGHEPGHASTVEDSLNQSRNDANSENLSSQETETQDVVNNCSNLSTSGRFHGETGNFNSSSTNIERDNQTVFNEGIDLLPPSGLTPRGHNNDASTIDGQATDIVIDSSQSMHDKQTGIGIDSSQSTGGNDEDDIVVDSSQPSDDYHKYTVIDTSQSTGDHYTDIVVDSFPETHDSHTCSYSGIEVINQTESNPNKTKLKTTGAVGPKGDNNQICVGLKLSPSFTIEEGQKGVIAVDHISSCTGITWFFGDGGTAAPQEIKTSEEGKYSGGSMAYPSLIIQDTTKQDSGYYFCVVKYEDREEKSSRTYLVVNSRSKGSEEKIVNYTMIKEVTNFHSGKSDEIGIQHESSHSDDSQNTDSSDEEGSEQDTSHLENAGQRDVEIEAKVDEETQQSSKDVLEKIIKLAQKFNFSVTDVFKDGNCLFHAASQQMESSINSESHFAENARVLRRVVVDFLRNNSETPEGEPYNKWLRDESWESFLDRMSRDGEYGNEIILRAICHCYNINVHVLSTLNEEAFTSYRAASDDSYTIFLGHDHNSQHYVILKPIDVRKEADSDLIDRANSYQSQQSLEVDTAPLPPRRPSHDVPSGLLESFPQQFDETFHNQTLDSTATIPSSYPSIISRREEEEEEEIAEEEESISDTLPDTDTLVLEEARNDDVQLLESQSFQNVHPQLIQVPMHIQTSDLMEHSLSKNEPIHALEILNISNGNDPQPRSTDFQHPSRQCQGQTVTMGAEGGHCVSSGYGSSMSLSSNQLTPESENENGMRSVPLPDAEPYATSTEQNNSSQEEEVPEVFDAVILHANADNEEVHDFIDNMKEEFPDLKVNLTTYEEFNLGKSLLSSAPLLFNKSRFVFVFKTQNFITEEIVKFLNEILLLSVITEEEKFHRLIPIDKDDVHVPELGPIIPLKYNRYLRAKDCGRKDQSYVRAFPRLIREGRNKYLMN